MDDAMVVKVQETARDLACRNGHHGLWHRPFRQDLQHGAQRVVIEHQVHVGLVLDGGERWQAMLALRADGALHLHFAVKLRKHLPYGERLLLDYLYNEALSRLNLPHAEDNGEGPAAENLAPLVLRQFWRQAARQRGQRFSGWISLVPGLFGLVPQLLGLLPKLLGLVPWLLARAQRLLGLVPWLLGFPQRLLGLVPRLFGIAQRLLTLVPRLFGVLPKLFGRRVVLHGRWARALLRSGGREHPCSQRCRERARLLADGSQR
mmetsp:Transcript_58153/g.162112  ORF Transcript_58153/g.162112 Transcript_58153/m.162112 type:complete len:262 (-) Transcript_58153:1337-2122(-)